MCGKNVSDGVTVTFPAGSPPRVREKLNQIVANGIASRITPACAGKTMEIIERFAILQDHPRVCGKNIKVPLIIFPFLGSPPRVREKPLKVFNQQCSLRITPACAGKTLLFTVLTSVARDHPRVCGKNFHDIHIHVTL